MNCDWVQQNISLYLYNELADDARHEVEQHIQRCKDCAAELAAQQEFQAEMNALPVEEPSASFLASARMRLQEALETTEQNRAWYHRLAFDPTAWLRQFGFAALAAVLLIVGFGGGLGTMYSALGRARSSRRPARGTGSFHCRHHFDRPAAQFPPSQDQLRTHGARFGGGIAERSPDSRAADLRGQGATTTIPGYGSIRWMR